MSVQVAAAHDGNSPELLARRLCSEEFAWQGQEESTAQVSGIMPGSLRRATLVQNSDAVGSVALVASDAVVVRILAPRLSLESHWDAGLLVAKRI